VPVLAFLVVALEVTEALLALQLLRRMGRWKDFIAGRRGGNGNGHRAGRWALQRKKVGDIDLARDWKTNFEGL